MSPGNLPVSENSTCKPPVHLSVMALLHLGVPVSHASEQAWTLARHMSTGSGVQPLWMKKTKQKNVRCVYRRLSERAVFFTAVSDCPLWALKLMKTCVWARAYAYKSSHLCPACSQLDVEWAAGYEQSVGEGLGRCIIHCHIAIIYEWQPRYDQRCGRVNRIPKGQWQGLGEGFIIADFIDVLQSCLCVCVCVRERVGTVTEPWRRKIGINMKKHHSVWIVNRLNCLCVQ